MPQVTAKRITPASSYASCLYRLELRKIKQTPEPRPLPLNQENPAQPTRQPAHNPLHIRPGVALPLLLMQAILRLNNGALAQQLETINPFNTRTIRLQITKPPEYETLRNTAFGAKKSVKFDPDAPGIHPMGPTRFLDLTMGLCDPKITASMTR